MRAPSPPCLPESHNGFIQQSTDELTTSDVDKHRLAVFVLQEASEPFPSFEQMEEMVNTEDDATSLSKDIESCQEKHSILVHKLCESQSKEYQSRRKLERDSVNEFDVTVNELPQRIQRYNSHLELQRDMNALSQLQYHHLAHNLLPRQAALVQTQNFPQNITQWHAVEDSEVKLRFAEFLTTTSRTAKERIMNMWGWTWPSVNALVLQYERNRFFKAGVDQLLEQPDGTALGAGCGGSFTAPRDVDVL